MKKRLSIIALLFFALTLGCQPDLDTQDPVPFEPSEEVDPEPTPGSEPEPEPEPEPTGPKSDKCDLTSLKFPVSINPGLSVAPVVKIRNIKGINLIMATFPEGSDLSAIVPFFAVSKKAKAIVGGQTLVNASTAIDLAANKTLTVEAEDGEHRKDYLLLVRTGNVEIDEKVYDFMEGSNLPAVGMAITKDEKIAYVGSYGLAEAEFQNPVPCTDRHLFRLASVSKSLTAICIMSLCQDGKLSLDDKVFAPGGILASLYPGTHAARVDDIMVKHLLSHLSGWNNTLAGDDPAFSWNVNYGNKTLQQRVEYLVKNVSPSTPGTSYSYFNTGFCILGQVIEAASGKSFESYLKEVAAKAGVSDIWVSKTAKSDKRDNECIFYSQNNAYPYDNNMEVAAACGGIIATPTDLMKIMLAVDYGTAVPDILSHEWLNTMYANRTTSTAVGYGYGWQVGHYTLGNVATWHTGNLAGTAAFWVRGKNGVNGVILCNSRYSSNDAAMMTTLAESMSVVKDDY